MKTEQKHHKFQQALVILRDEQASFNADMIYSLSDLSDAQLAEFRTVWVQLSAERRCNLMLRLVDTAETNFELDFSAIVYLALFDPDAAVRQAAVEGVLEDSPFIIAERLVALAQDDPSAEVRAAATNALGIFILQGELGELPERKTRQLQDTVLALHLNPHETLEVRRRALEAFSNCGHEDLNNLIRAAYYADELPMRVSAVFAMGRSCDDTWTKPILHELHSDHPEIRYEAARAAGELELREAVGRLAEMAHEDDREIQEMAIWALGEIGGKSARLVLTQLAALADDSGDDDLAEAIEEALSSTSLAADDELLLMEFDELDEEDEDFRDQEMLEAFAAYADFDGEFYVDEDEDDEPAHDGGLGIFDDEDSLYGETERDESAL